MRSGAAAGTDGYFHEAAFYGSDDEFLAIVLPFVTDGVAAGEPTLVTLAESNSELVKSALADISGVTFIPADLQYARPAAAIRSYQELMAEHAQRGVAQIRIVGDVPHPGFGAPWGWWARYEAAVNDAYAPYPVWGLCPYDVRTAPADVLADVARTHPRLATSDGQHLLNPDFATPTMVLSDLMDGAPPAEPGRPTVELFDPTAAAARSAVQSAAAGGPTTVTAAEVQDLVFAVSEAVENAVMYGSAPVRVRVWRHLDRLVAHITDAGPGPSHALTGLVRAVGSASAGVGLWLAHQMCSDVTLHRGAEGFTLRVAVGASVPHAAGL
ncbi:sensor histidine kinase [Mycolicibacterium bacteremicum]|uniref:sensor histidine kinase n=1 Tax=Mycolicibacterium bacteremicum TaxID=564198 RepID=UPI0026E97833|nr:sensor histidine kinase [Mycolicibacterium bacteremicum]